MSFSRNAVAFVAAVIVAYGLASVFYTMRVLAEQAAIGARYTPAQQVETYLINLTGLWVYGLMIAIALLIAFVAAALIRRAAGPLRPVAYPVAGGAAIFVLLSAVESQLGGGAGIIGGARTASGVALQCLAGVAGGVVFALASARRDRR